MFLRLMECQGHKSIRRYCFVSFYLGVHKCEIIQGVQAMGIPRRRAENLVHKYGCDYINNYKEAVLMEFKDYDDYDKIAFAPSLPVLL